MEFGFVSFFMDNWNLLKQASTACIVKNWNEAEIVHIMMMTHA